MKHYFWIWLVVVSGGCQPHFEERASLVTKPQVLAVRAEPAESNLGQMVEYEALVVTPEGPSSTVPLQWSFCAAPKPLTENNAVSAACLDAAVLPIAGAEFTISASTPMDACQLFGPDAPPGDFRPRDADDTGGYYQPLRIETLGQTAFVFERVTCNLSNAPLDVAVEFAKQYVPNRNPRIFSVQAYVDGQNEPLDVLPASQDVQIEITWESTEAETFVVFDPATQKLKWQRESLRVFWYATGGVFEHDVTGRDENDAALGASNTWHAPDKPAEVHLWIVLRDNRGGTDFRHLPLSVIL